MERPLGLENFRATDREQCGIIIRDSEKMWVVEVENVADNDDDYAITVIDFHNVYSTLEEGEEIVGFFHTHLPHHSVEPTSADYEGASLFPGLTNLVYKPDTNECVWYGIADKPDEVDDET